MNDRFDLSERFSAVHTVVSVRKYIRGHPGASGLEEASAIVVHGYLVAVKKSVTDVAISETLVYRGPSAACASKKLRLPRCNT